MPIQCPHSDQATIKSSDKHVCEDCVAKGDRWVQLRLCMSCGYVGCCDSSKNKHARAHFQQTQHALIRPAAGEGDWVWCYVDNDYVGRIEDRPGQAA